jgi:predicted ribosomally synthesized peptide with nif11-like leader
MSTESYKAFTARIGEDESLRDEILSAGASDGMSMETLASIASGYGYRFTARDVSHELLDERIREAADGAFGIARLAHEYWKVGFDPLGGSLHYFKYYK